MSTEILSSLQSSKVDTTLICLDPNGENAKLRYDEEQQNVSSHVWNQIRGILGARELARVKILLYDKIPRFNIILIDGRNEKKDSYAIVQHYSYQRGGSSPQFIIKKYNKDSITALYNYYQEAFDYIYEKAYDYKQHLSEEHNL